MRKVYDRRGGVLVLLAVVALALGLAACESKQEADKKGPEEKEQAAAPAEPGGGDQAAAGEAGAGEPVVDSAAAGGETGAGEQPGAAGEEYLRFNIMHHDPAKGPVDGSFQFKLVSARVDLENLAESYAEYEVELGTVLTGIEQRDQHLKSPDFFDVAVFPAARVRIHGVAKGEGEAFTATASIDLKGIKADVPVRFKIVEQLEGGGIVIEGGAALTRSQFGVGAAPEATGAADPLTVSVRLKVASTP